MLVIESMPELSIDQALVLRHYPFVASNGAIGSAD
jgi:hypothetical protein